jgi:hypothetical protein
MPFHVEISVSSLRHARVFNLGEDELRASILEPWMAGRTIELGDQEWIPRDSSLRVLDGPRLEGPDLSFGQGWSNAERSARDATAEALAAAEREAPPMPEAAAIEADSLESAIEALAGGAEPRRLELAAAQAAIYHRTPEVAAVILVTRPRPEPPEPSRS